MSKEVIVAISTAIAPAAIGIIRLSGEGCFEILEKVFHPSFESSLKNMPDRKLVLGKLLDRKSNVIDMPLACIFRAPHSYTGEDCAEIHCHGSQAVLTEAVLTLIQAGARQARAGEFTQRAFLNGRMDLTAAEAVIDLIEAETVEAARNAAGQLGGAVLRKIESVYEQLESIIAHFQAIIDYPDEDIEPITYTDIVRKLSKTKRELEQLYSSFERGQYLKTGVPAAIIGSPNSGKSTLLNALLGFERAIVTPLAGTTRDTIEERITLGGITFRLADTAGIHGTDNEVEKIGVARSRQAAADAKLSLLLLDGSRELNESDFDAMRTAQFAEKIIPIINKCDLPQIIDVAEVEKRLGTTIKISAATGKGLDLLEEAVKKSFSDTPPVQAGEVLTNIRQREAIGCALEAVNAALTAVVDGITFDAALSDAEIAMQSLAELTGRSVTEDVVNNIFSRFCVGK